MYQDEFTLTLVSNTKTGFDTNTCSEFTNHLAERIHLEEGTCWEVALTALSCPERVLLREQKITVSKPGGKNDEDKFLPKGFYSSLELLIEGINNALHGTAILTYALTTGMVNITILLPDVKAIKFGPELARILGTEKQTEALLEANDGMAFIYMNIIKAQFSGDSKTPLLQIAPLKSVTGGQMMSYALPTYIPVSAREFDRVTLEIADSYSRPISFCTGITTARLHFRRKL